MEKINTITVNGVTYDIGGNAQDDNSYIIPVGFNKLANSADVQDLINIFGSQEGFNDFLSACNEKELFITVDGNCVLPVSVVYKTGDFYCYLTWLEFSKNKDPMLVKCTIMLSSTTPLMFTKIISNLYVDKSIEVDIYDLNESSASEEIKTALGGGGSFKGIGTGAEQFGAKQKKYTGTQGLNAYCDLGLTYIKEEGGDSIYKLSCNLPGCFGKEKGGIISIRYSSGTYSVESILAF